MKSLENSTPSSAAGCCFTTNPPENPARSEKYIMVYPYSDPKIPFEMLTPRQITFYFHVTNKTGKPSTLPLLGGAQKPTCAANCSGCYFQTLPPYEIDPETAKKIAADFRERGYDIGLITADSFSDIALNDIAQAGSAFRYKITRQNGNAWTSGNLLSRGGAADRLDKGWELGYGIITISLYNTVLDHPMKGVPRTEPIIRTINNIKDWNRTRFPNGGGYDIITTQLISSKSCNIESMRKVAKWCLENGIRICRFNAFANFMNQEEMREFELTAEDIKQFWGSLAQLQEEFFDTPLQFGVSEDMSATGIESCIPYFNPKDNWKNFDPENPYWCRAGYRLFSINAVTDEVSGRVKLAITGCVDNWSKAPIGEVILDDETGRYYPKFNVEAIETLRAAIVNKTISTCWGGVGNPNGKQDTRGMVPSSIDEKAVFEKIKTQ